MTTAASWMQQQPQALPLLDQLSCEQASQAAQVSQQALLPNSVAAAAAAPPRHHYFAALDDDDLHDAAKRLCAIVCLMTGCAS